MKGKLLDTFPFDSLHIINPEDLSLSQGSNKNVVLCCKRCNSTFDRKVYRIKHGECPYCNGRRVNHTNNINKCFPEIIPWLKDKNDGTKYTAKSNCKIPLICIECQSEFSARIDSLSHGSRCPFCAGLKINHTNNLHRTLPDIIPYLVDQSDAHNYTRRCDRKVCLKCVKCNHLYSTSVSNFAAGHRCPKCTRSRGENMISEWLQQNNIEFIHQYRIPECKNILPLPFDFAIFINKELYGLIEYHGKQHKLPIAFFGGRSEFQKRKNNDLIKQQYCEKNNIPLLIVWFDTQNITSILNDWYHLE